VVGWPANAWTGEGWPDLLVWLSPNLFGFEVKQGKGRATERQLSRLIYLRKHHVWAYIVRSPHDALTVMKGVIEGTMTFNEDLLAELDAALLGGPVEAPAATASPTEPVPLELEPLPFDDVDLVAQAQAQLKTPEHQHAVDVVMNGVAEPQPSIQEEADAAYEAQLKQEQTVEREVIEAVEVIGNAVGNLALNRLADAAEAIVLELQMLRKALQPIVEAEPVMTSSAPAPRRRLRGGKNALEPEPATESD